MKILVAIIGLSLGTLLGVSAQNNTDSTLEVATEQNITMEDILDALEVSGIQIHKFNTGEFDKKYVLEIVIEEYENDTLKLKEVLFKGKNWYTTFDNKKQPLEKYVDQIRIISKEEEDKCQLSINMNGVILNREFSFIKTYNRQIFRWHDYAKTNWILNKKTPLMAYISSWQDNRGYIRLCGPNQLKNGEQDTELFFSRSPNYFIISYIISEQNP